jgi:hypothetical protein
VTALAFALKNWRWIAAGLLALSLIGTGMYVRSVFAERDQLRQEQALLTEKLKSAAAMQQLTNQITEAIGQIKLESQINVSRIESAPKPVFVDSRPLPFIPGGLLQAVYSSGSAADRAPSGPVPGGALPAGRSAGGILSR